MKSQVMAGMVLLMIAAMFYGCAGMREPDWYTVTGTGVADASTPLSQASLLSKRAAKLDAQRILLEAAKGVHIKSTTTVENFMTTDDYIRSRVEGIIRGAEMTDSRYFEDGSWEVDMRIDMNQVLDLVR